MELEYKWKMPDLTSEQILERLSPLGAEIRSNTEFKMRAAYYDTDDRIFTEMHGALRIREENGQRICCMKLSKSASGACTTREEYEVPADSVQEGLRKLPAQGASQTFCETVMKHDIIQLCEINFTRIAYQLRFSVDGEVCEGELAIDQGLASKETTSIPISEVEFEHKSGSISLFHKCAEQIKDALSLEPQTLSKLAQIMLAE